MHTFLPRPTLTCLVLAFAIAVASAITALPASAGPDACYHKVVKAQGGAGLLEATAKSRARSAWIKKVRAHRRLGKSYAAWLRARKHGYACRKTSRRRFICVASAIPCKV